MEDLEIVGAVVEKDFKSGVSAKSGKTWAMHKYRTNSGKDFTSFDDLELGDTVKLTYNDQYKNYSGARPRKADTQHDELMAKVNEILEIVKELKGL